jgi:hypothetical protein
MAKLLHQAVEIIKAQGKEARHHVE